MGQRVARVDRRKGGSGRQEPLAVELDASAPAAHRDQPTGLVCRENSPRHVTGDHGMPPSRTSQYSLAQRLQVRALCRSYAMSVAWVWNPTALYNAHAGSEAQ